MYVFDTTGNSCDVMYGHDIIATVKDIETAKTLCHELNKMRSALEFIYDIAHEDLRVDEAAGSTWTIEAVAAKAIGKTAEDRDADITADRKLHELINEIADACRKEVGENLLKVFLPCM